jgi:3',5'-cyclic AMP phosphodiesterase CpdA
VVLAGNHDLPLFAWWLRWGRAYDRFAAQFGAQLEPHQQVGPFCVVGVNTTRPWRHERGSLSARQVDRVAADLLAAPNDAWCIVASHHPLVARCAQDRSHRPLGADAAVARWREAGADMLLSGHVHQPGLSQPLPGLWSMQAGTAVSHRLRWGQPNSLVVLQVQSVVPALGLDHGGPAPQQRLAQRWDFDAKAGDFVCVESMQLV